MSLRKPDGATRYMLNLWIVGFFAMGLWLIEEYGNHLFLALYVVAWIVTPMIWRLTPKW